MLTSTPPTSSRNARRLPSSGPRSSTVVTPSRTQQARERIGEREDGDDDAVVLGRGRSGGP